MSRIGIDIRNIGKGRTGDEVVFFNIAKHLALLDDKNQYYLFTDITDDRVVSDIRSQLGIVDRENFTIVSLPTRNKFTWNLLTIPKYLRENPLDIFLTQYITPFFVSNRIKIITIIHDISFNFYPKMIHPVDLFFLKVLIPISIHRADLVIGVSQFTRDEIKKYYSVPEAKLNWIHNAVSENILSASSDEAHLNAIRQKYHLPEKFILYIGTMQPRKNIPCLLAAYAQLIDNTSSNIELVVAGGKGHNFDKHIDAIIKEKKLSQHVIFPGYIAEEDKAAVISLAHVFCYPSLYEGFGIPIIEAMGRQVPVIASDIPPHREIADEAVLFFDPNDPRDLKEKMTKVLHDADLRERLIRKGIEQANKYSWDNTAKKILSIFNGIA
jgi:glycosyltransferase involved in cell wall biosynthesis